jgi:signal transduction histidine kinase
VKKTLYGKLSAILIAFLALLGLIFILVTLFTTRLYYQETSQKLNSSLAKKLVSDRMFLEDGVVNEAALEEAAYELMEINPEMDVYLLDNNGQILSASVGMKNLAVDTVAIEPVVRFMRGDMFPLLGDDPMDPGMPRVFSACSIPIDGPLEGYLYIVLGMADDTPLLASLSDSRVLQGSLLVVVVGLLLVSAFAMLIFRQVTRRLRLLTSGVESFQDTGLGADLASLPHAAGRGDEIDRLGGAFAEMARRISEQVAEIRAADSTRRELITNISHDLRTPLTSLQGYLETLAFKEDLDPAERDKYMQTALKHSDRLRRLVSDLFELSKLDSAEVVINTEPFSLSELCQDVLVKFELLAGEKGVELNARFDPDLPFVSADIGRIERVLENLVKNGIEHTPPGGRVEIALAAADGSVEVRVSDTGSGIPAEDLPHIFDPYYRSSSGPAAGKEGTGLGLAIARRIINLHGSEITVESELDSGTVFTCRLVVAT